MGAFCEAYGSLDMVEEENANRVREYLLLGGWLEKDADGLRWNDSENAPIPSKGKTVVFNGGIQKNLLTAIRHILDALERFGYLEETSSLRVISTDGGVCACELSLQPTEKEGEFIGEMIALDEDEIREAAGFDFGAYEKACEGEELDEEVLSGEEMKLSEWVLDA